MSRKQLVPLNAYTSPTAPSGRTGDMYFDTTTFRLRIYYNGSWNDLAYLSDLTNLSPSGIDGGYANSFVFDDILNGGGPATISFDAIIDAGVLV